MESSSHNVHNKNDAIFLKDKMDVIFCCKT